MTIQVRLKRLFSIKDLSNHVTFKGGTSLSKVYHAIERFSEDVDVTISRSFLGFDGENDPEKGASKKEIGRRIESLKSACQDFVGGQLLTELRDAAGAHLTDDHGLHLDKSDPDLQTVTFQYPAAITTAVAPYFPQSVKIELGARSDDFPIENKTLRPYLAHTIEGAMGDPDVNVQVIDVVRTFWEKAVILHRIANWREGKNLPPRLSRHYYDLYNLARHQCASRALGNKELLARVAEQHSVYFPAAWANYGSATPGSLQLIPKEKQLAELKHDYRQMQPMFFAEVPTFENIISRLRSLESKINSSQ